jgi:NAD(P)-dependent dehydrogenase (short-subunit alcohol dehydrogenase family)
MSRPVASPRRHANQEIKLENRVILITGGSRGIGYATAERLVAEGARVVLTGRSESAGDEAVQKLRAAGGEALFVQADAGVAGDCERMVRETLSAFGRLDGAFNNAGQEPDARRARIHEYEGEDWESILAVHLSGLFYAMKNEIPPMIEGGGGAIVNMSSIYGAGAAPTCPPSYVSAKHGAIGITRTAAIQYAKEGIRANVVCPGYVRTQLFDRMFEENPHLKEKIYGLHPMGRLAEPSEVADAVCWLLSEASSFVTGNVLNVDGGISARI